MLYQYSKLNHYTLQNLLIRSIWLSNPKKFKDIYDCNTAVQPCETEKDLLKQYEWLDYLKQGEGLGKTREELYYSFLETNSYTSPEAYRRNLDEVLEKEYGVSCFTSDWQNNKMWDEYGDGYKGICIKYDFSFDQRINSNLISVKYYDLPLPIITVKVIGIDSYKDEESFLKEYISIKERKYSYEGETRLLMPFQGYCWYDKKCFQEIIFGRDIKMEIIREIINKVKIYYPGFNSFYRLKFNHSLPLSKEVIV